MELQQLRINDVRLIERLELELGAGWNFFVGPNGAGKTSILEATYLLSHGRSFRTGAKEALVRGGAAGYSVFGRLRRADGSVDRVGVARNGNRLEARHDGDLVTMGDLLHRAAVLCFEPGSHELISGASDLRRRFIDWGVFHVEQDFLGQWRRYQRALKQRNALLRGDASDGELDVWDHELALAAEPLTELRTRYCAQLRPILAAQLHDLLSELGAPDFEFHPGFDPGQPLLSVLAGRRGRDRARGYTSAGPHRSDWSLTFEGAPRREYLSRGQEKLCAFACVMAQARLFAEISGEWPIIGLDDIASELDVEHQERIFATVHATRAQILATGTELPAAFSALDAKAALFHVEQGRVTALL
ncbi:MAG: DNA replication/repair protein RecF [Dokdonella sp.]